MASKVKKAIQKTKKPVAKKASTKTAAKKSVAKKPAKKMPVKKLAAKKPVAKKLAAKKPVAKAIVKKAAPQKPVQKPAAHVHAQPKAAMKSPITVKPIAVAIKPAAEKPVAAKASYKVGNYVVYPTHGVGKILAEETQMIGEIELRMLVINFEKDKMTLRVPMHRAAAAGLRPISGMDQIKNMFVTLKSRAKTSRGMWSRRAQEYEGKINSGNLIEVAEVVRDLHQNVDQSERSYSERMIYESALARIVGELSAAEGTDHKTATDKLMKLLRAKVAAAAALKEAA